MRKRLLLATLGTAPALAALTAGSPALGAITATLFTTSTLGESVNVNKSVLLLAKRIVSPASTVTCAGWKPLGPSPTYSCVDATAASPTSHASAAMPIRRMGQRASASFLLDPEERASPSATDVNKRQRTGVR
jgi:hypothetical protein